MESLQFDNRFRHPFSLTQSLYMKEVYIGIEILQNVITRKITEEICI